MVRRACVVRVAVVETGACVLVEAGAGDVNLVVAALVDVAASSDRGGE